MNRLTIGHPARKDNFYDRPNEVEALWCAIESGSNTLIAAPRRVGKTSIMMKLYDEPREGYVVLYEDTESIRSEELFWKRIFDLLTKEEQISRVARYSAKASVSLKAILQKIKQIGAKGVELKDGSAVDYATAIENLLMQIDVEQKLVIMIDEFPQTVEDIRKEHGDEEACYFLSRNRALRLNPKISEKVAFIYTGSIGLHGVASQLDATKYINDLHTVSVPPLSKHEASEFIRELIDAVEISMEDNLIQYALDKVEWFIPHYFQLIVQELQTICRRSGTAVVTDEDVIDCAITEILKNNGQFEHWESRLKVPFKGESYKYARELLCLIADKGTVDIKAISNLAGKHKISSEKQILQTLIYDGYINNDDDPKVYRFNSPLLRMWWNKNVAN